MDGFADGGFAPAIVAVRISWSVRSRAMCVRAPVTITEARSRAVSPVLLRGGGRIEEVTKPKGFHRWLLMRRR